MLLFLHLYFFHPDMIFSQMQPTVWVIWIGWVIRICGLMLEVFVWEGVFQVKIYFILMSFFMMSFSYNFISFKETFQIKKCEVIYFYNVFKNIGDKCIYILENWKYNYDPMNKNSLKKTQCQKKLSHFMFLTLKNKMKNQNKT